MTELEESGLCHRGSDVVAFLYGEASETELVDFRKHLKACLICREELSSFGDVREGVAAWRNEALRPSLAGAPNPQELTERQVIRLPANRSALSALREFFALSPLWLRGATAFAAVLFVSLLVVTGLRFFGREESVVVRHAQPSSTGLVLDGKVLVASTPAKSNSLDSERVPVNQAVADNTKNTGTTHKQQKRKSNAPILSNEERSQLGDLLIAERKDDEDSVPRLYDLLSESN